jgi:hypothetical protein
VTLAQETNMMKHLEQLLNSADREQEEKAIQLIEFMSMVTEFLKIHRVRMKRRKKCFFKPLSTISWLTIINKLLDHWRQKLKR